MLVFTESERVTARAVNLGERLDVRALKKSALLTMPPMIIKVGEAGYAVIFRYGVAVMFGLNQSEEKSLLEDIRPFVVDPFSKEETEELVIRIDRSAEELLSSSGVIVREMSLSHLQAIADILAKSVVLAHYESQVSSVFDKVEPIAHRLQSGHRRAFPDQAILQHIGQALQIEHKLVGRAQVGEKPEVLWEQPQLERLYKTLEDEYEIAERQLALDRKLDVVSRTAETMHNLMQNRRALRVEWYIVILILIEIVLSLYDLFIKSH